MAAGRPTSYTEDMPERIIKYFDQPLYIMKKKQIASGGRAVTIEEERPNSMPTFEGFALSVGVIHKTLRNWCAEHPEFLQAYNACSEIQKGFIVEHGMMGNYNPGFTKFIAVNCTDLRDKVTHEIEGKGITLNVTRDESSL